jgi:hypothetical protein
MTRAPGLLPSSAACTGMHVKFWHALSRRMRLSDRGGSTKQEKERKQTTCYSSRWPAVRAYSSCRVCNACVDATNFRAVWSFSRLWSQSVHELTRCQALACARPAQPLACAAATSVMTYQHVTAVSRAATLHPFADSSTNEGQPAWTITTGWSISPCLAWV